MKTVMTTRRQTQWMAGTVAALATLLTVGGQLILAAHYAQTGTSSAASSYYASEQTGRVAYPDNRNYRATAASPRREAKKS